MGVFGLALLSLDRPISVPDCLQQALGDVQVQLLCHSKLDVSPIVPFLLVRHRHIKQFDNWLPTAAYRIEVAGAELKLRGALLLISRHSILVIKLGD